VRKSADYAWFFPAWPLIWRVFFAHCLCITEGNARRWRIILAVIAFLLNLYAKTF